MNYVTHNIDVRLHTTQDRGSSSSAGQTQNRKRKTSYNKIPSKGKKAAGTKKMAALGKVGIAAVAASKAAEVAGKTANRYGRAVGSVTGNRYRQKRITDVGDAIKNPIGFGASIYKEYVEEQFETQRENSRIEYRRRLTGMSLPVREGNHGVTI